MKCQNFFFSPFKISDDDDYEWERCVYAKWYELIMNIEQCAFDVRLVVLPLWTQKKICQQKYTICV